MPSNKTLDLDVNQINKIKKITILFLLIAFALSILVFSVSNTMSNYRRLPKLLTSKKELAVRGDIISSDNFKISSSKKLYKASIDTRFLDLNKKDLFIKLFSIYSNIQEKIIRKKINKSLKKPGSIVLSYNIDSRSAKNLKELGFKLRRLKVFKSVTVRGGKILRGLSVNESGEKRLYSYTNALTPVVGYISKYESKQEKTKVKGIKGLEKSYDELLNNTKDGILKGERDVLSYISFNKESVIKSRDDGATLSLNIPLKLQKNIEMILDNYKKKLQAKEIIISIVESNTGKVLSLATSNRFDPQNIKQKDIPSLNVKAIEHPYEPGSILKPISLALVLNKNLVKKNELLFAYNKSKPNKKGEYKRGSYKIGRFRIKDDHRFKKHYLTIDDIIVYSSNIGILQLVQRLRGEEFSSGLKKFGITERTGIDLPYEKRGRMPKVYQFRAGESKGKDNVFKATVSYGQGMTSTFMQMLKAYTVFNNDGYIVTPQIVSALVTPNNKTLTIDNQEPIKVISKRSANQIKRMLIKTVNEGTGVNTKIEGLEIGGKTGTAQIARGGKYLRRYISSFFGFANDKNNKYTIGVTVFEPVSTGKYWYYHYASHSAAPVYKELVQTLLKFNYLTPEPK